MRNGKRTLAAVVALTLTASMMGACSKEKDSSSEFKEQVDVEDYEGLQDIPDDAEKTIVYLGEGDLNPTKANGEKSTELALFEMKGGTIEFKRTTNSERFNDLANAIMANSVDIFKYEWLAFPSQIVKDMYQPIDEIVDFDNTLWNGAKATADQYQLGGKHYIAPLGYDSSSMIFYDKDTIEELDMEDPLDLFNEGNWNWNTMQELMEAYVAAADPDEQRYGINGFYKPHIIQQTGKTMITYDEESNSFVNNTADPDIARAEEWLYNITKENLVNNEWVGSARDCFDRNILFYAMGSWAATGLGSGPKEDDNWGVVPIPNDPNNPDAKITTSNMTAYMWVKGSTAKEAVKTWFEACRIAYNDPQYEETNMEKFFVSNPYWTEDDYNMMRMVNGDDYTMLFEYGYGVSAKLGDRNQFDKNQCLIDALYGDVTVVDDETGQKTWAQVRETYEQVINQELDSLNTNIKTFLNE